MQAPDPETWVWLVWLKLALYAMFAALGGMLGHVMRALDKREQIMWFRALVEGIAAGFVGMLFYLVCQAMGMSEQWTGVIVGVSGWLGATASIKLLESAVYKKLGLGKTAAPTEEPKDENPVQ
jgi:ABC-type transport system involved in cytochrome c biogenesis permease subunit